MKDKELSARATELCMEFQKAYWRGITGKPVSPERQAIGAKYANLLRLYHLKWRSRSQGLQAEISM